ncbi:hypothetical protein G3545_06690 [Starkeya sp. ORNL1]|uniref:hypothetical protein n=1 Tax=Starkeya sp. ORNL1 TaxID=2709380 RepID=UPI001463450B|nr:hypothetical protein [Starkeya sp. ORNL1]QJP13369.1 hypothetical protein G3545_06690 [Starkeya sp. ORNL1]
MNPTIRISNLGFGTDGFGNPVTLITVYLKSDLLETPIELSFPQDENLGYTFDLAVQQLRNLSDQIILALDEGLKFEGSV